MDLIYPDPLATAASLGPQKIALTTKKSRLSFGDLASRVQQTSSWLCAEGLSAGDRVAVRHSGEAFTD